MKAIDSYYTSVTDQRWFTGNPNLNEKWGFTWFIDCSSVKRSGTSWKISVSEKAPEYGTATPRRNFKARDLKRVIPSYRVI